MALILRDVILTLVSVKELSSKRTLQNCLGYKLHYEKWVIGKLLFYNFICVFSLSCGKISNKKQLKRKKLTFSYYYGGDSLVAGHVASSAEKKKVNAGD